MLNFTLIFNLIWDNFECHIKSRTNCLPLTWKWCAWKVGPFIANFEILYFLCFLPFFVRSVVPCFCENDNKAINWIKRLFNLLSLWTFHIFTNFTKLLCFTSTTLKGGCWKRVGSCAETICVCVFSVELIFSMNWIFCWQ